MDTTNKDWNQPGTWAEELVEQAKDQQKKAEMSDERHFKMFKMSFALNVLLAIIIAALSFYYTHEANSYDYIYQDGAGQNNYNRDVEGDVSNVSTNQGEEEWEE